MTHKNILFHMQETTTEVQKRESFRLSRKISWGELQSGNMTLAFSPVKQRETEESTGKVQIPHATREEPYRVLLRSFTRRFCIQVAMFRRRNQSNKETRITDKGEKVQQLRDALGPVSGRSLKFCTDPCLRRYLEARNWNVDKAQIMLEESLKWRETYKPEEIRWHEVAHEGETGKVSKANFHDRKGGTVLIMRPGKQNTTSPEGNIRHLVYLVENAILNLPEGQEQMSWLIDFNGWSLNTNVPIKTARDIIYILENHYPERLAIVVFYSPPKIFEAFWKVVKYFVDQKAFQKIKFVYPSNKDSVELMKTFFDAEILPSEFGGNGTLNYNHEEFSRLMVQEDVKTAKFWELDDEPVPQN